MTISQGLSLSEIFGTRLLGRFQMNEQELWRGVMGLGGCEVITLNVLLGILTVIYNDI
jgi:hypothetical protein